jgi:Uma2 family endonuclease
LSLVLSLYETGTPGVELTDNSTVILGEESEPQPDLNLRILTECGGQVTVNEKDYLEGAPELVAEVAHSSRAIDLNQKRNDYEQAGVREYLVLNLEDRLVHWFDFVTGRPIRPDRDGIARSRVFPGLWVDIPRLLARDGRLLIKCIEEGTASRPHATFVKRLERARRGR